MIRIKKISAIGWMLLSAFSFALMAAFSHSVSKSFDWKVVAFARVFINFIFVSVLALSTGHPLILFSAPRSLWYRSIAGTISLLAMFYVFSKLPIGEATSINNMYPLWMVLLIAVATKEHIPKTIWFSVLCGIAGVFCIQQPHFAEGNFAVVVGLLGGFFAAFAVYNLHLTKNLHPTTIVAHFTLIGSVMVFFVMLPSLSSIFESNRYSLPIILGLIGVGASGTVAQLSMTRAYMKGNPAINSTVGLAQVAFATGLDILIWNRSFDTMTIIGILLITIPTTLFVARIQLRNRTQSV